MTILCLKLGEIKLKNKCTSIIRLPIIINDIDKRQSTGNLNKLNNYLDQKFTRLSNVVSWSFISTYRN